MNNIYLIGMPGCGKSTIGKLLSSKLGMKFIDLDEYIVMSEGKSIDTLFEEGENVFRDAESRALMSLHGAGALVATGGGIICRSENTAEMKKSGTVIFIDTSVKNILENSSLEGRPLLRDKSAIYKLYDSRISLYRSAADYTVENNSFLSTACDETEKIIRRRRNGI